MRLPSRANKISPKLSTSATHSNSLNASSPSHPHHGRDPHPQSHPHGIPLQNQTSSNARIVTQHSQNQTQPTHPQQQAPNNHRQVVMPKPSTWLTITLYRTILLLATTISLSISLFLLFCCTTFAITCTWLISMLQGGRIARQVTGNIWGDFTGLWQGREIHFNIVGITKRMIWRKDHALSPMPSPSPSSSQPQSLPSLPQHQVQVPRKKRQQGK